MTWPAADTAQAVKYLFAHWDLNPDAWAETNTTDDTAALRASTWEALNAATDGALALLVPDPHDPHWIFTFGLAVTEYWKGHP